MKWPGALGMARKCMDSKAGGFLLGGCGLARSREIVSEPCACDQGRLAASERNFSAWPRMPFAIGSQMRSGKLRGSCASTDSRA